MKKSRIFQVIGFTASRISILITIGFLGLIIFHIVERGMGVISWEFLTQSPSQAMTAGGIFPAIIGTIYLVGLVAIITLPIGIMTAVYIVEYSSKKSRLKGWITQAVYNLRGVPSVVIGLFGLTFFVRILGFGASLLSASLSLSFIALPTVIVASIESLRSVPQSFRDASAGLGASKWQTITKIILPAAFPGIITGSILGIGEAAGETAPILFTGAVFFTRGLPTSIFDRFMALPYHLYALNAEAPNAAAARPMAYGTALVLLVFVLLFFITATIIRNYYRGKRGW